MIDDDLKQFLQNRQSYCSEATLTYYYDNLSRFIKFCRSFGVDSSNEITQKLFESYLCNLSASEISKVSIRTYMRAVKSFINWLIDNDKLHHNPALKLRLPRPDAQPVLPLSAQEVLIINSYINKYFEDSDRTYLIFHLMLDCGLRSGEVVRLRTSDVISDSNIIRIFRTKGNKSRFLPVPELLMNYLQYYIKETSKERKLNKTNQVFLLEDGRPIDSECIKRICTKIKRVTGIERFHAHLCRHTFATSFLMGGGNMESLRVLTGHEDYDVLKGYLHIAHSMELMNIDIYRLDERFFQQFRYR